MQRDYPEDRNEYQRLDTDLSQQDPADSKDDETDMPRRDTMRSIMDTIEPDRPRRSNEAVYGDTDLDPNRDDVLDEHHADADDRV